MTYDNFPLEEFKIIINLFEKEGICYYVFGGFSYDAINNQIRNHGDLDVVVKKEHAKRLTNILIGERYQSKKLGRLIKYYKKVHEEIYSIGVLWLKEYKDFYKIRGNWVEDILSKEDFNDQNFGKIKDIKFKIMPFEWFYLYKDVKHFNQKKEEYHSKTIKNIISFCREMRILKQRSIKRLKSDPKYSKSK